MRRISRSLRGRAHRSAPRSCARRSCRGPYGAPVGQTKSIASIIAIIAALASFFFSARGAEGTALITAFVAIIGGAIGFFKAASPRVSGGLLSLAAVALGAIALPRGGTVDVEIAGNPPNVSFVVRAKGDSARLADQVKSLLTGANGVAVDAHSIQPYYTRRVAGAAGMTLMAEAREGEVEFKAA